MLVEFETLSRMFEHSPDKSRLVFKSCCHSCGCEVTIEIHRLPTGFGLNGGVIFESNSDQLIAKCDDCHNNKLKLVCKQKEECKKQYLATTNSGVADLSEKILVEIKSNL